MLQRCHFFTNITAVAIVSDHRTKPIEINLRMAKSSFSLKTHDKYTEIIDRQGEAQISWMLWKTEFQINSFHIMSNYKNFTQSINRIVSYETGQTFHGTISETQYASGSGLNLPINITWFVLVLLKFQVNAQKLGSSGAIECRV